MVRRWQDLFSKTFIMLVILFLVAAAIRISVAAWMGLDDVPLPGSDSVEYDTYAWNLAQGKGFRGMSPDVSDQNHLTAYRPPLTSIVWSGLYKVFGHRYDVVRLMNSVLGALSCVLLFYIGNLAFNRTVGWYSAVIWAIFPSSIYFSIQLYSEPIMLVLLLAFVMKCLQFSRKPGWGSAALAGALLGLLFLVNPSKVIMLPLVASWGLWQFRKNLHDLLLSVVIPIVAIAMLVPWTVRNYQVFDEFIPFSTMGGSVLLQGNNRIVATDPSRHGYVIWDTKIPEYASLLQAPNDEVERDRVARSLAIEWISENRDMLPSMMVAKIKRGLTPLLQKGAPAYEFYGMLFSWGPVLIISILAFPLTLVSMLRKNDPGWIIHLTILHFFIITVIFFGYARYRYGVEPLFVLLVIGFLEQYVVKMRTIRSSKGFSV
jgi:4-amino-4-deoxy-L-arabinose transferase-like glycosyltransferase